jgi:hypothetical protein
MAIVPTRPHARATGGTVVVRIWVVTHTGFYWLVMAARLRRRTCVGKDMPVLALL